MFPALCEKIEPKLALSQKIAYNFDLTLELQDVYQFYYIHCKSYMYEL